MRILFIVPKLSGGGAENVAAQLASALSARHEVRLVCLAETTEAQYPLDERVQRIDLQRNGEISRLFPWERHTSDDDLLTKRISRMKRSWRPDASISFLERSNYLNVRSRVGERVIVSIRNNYTMKFPFDSDQDKRQRSWARYVNEHADWVACISEFVRADQIAHFGAHADASSVIYNPCDAVRLRERAQEPLSAQDEAWFAEGGPVVIAVGRLVPQKGHGHLIRAFRSVVRAVPDARLAIVGEGPLRDHLAALIAACGLDDRVWLAGHRANPYPLFARADVFAFPSLYEGLGNALLEAMALGLPSVVADCPGGPRELLLPGCDPLAFTHAEQAADCGILCPACPADSDWRTDDLQGAGECEREEQAMADALVRLLRDASLRDQYSQAARARALDFAPAAILAQWEALMNRVTG